MKRDLRVTAEDYEWYAKRGLSPSPDEIRQLIRERDKAEREAGLFGGIMCLLAMILFIIFVLHYDK
jgi:hypothetical protein